MYLKNKKLYLWWRHRIYLRSTGWKLTRKRVFREMGEFCHEYHPKSKYKIIACENKDLQIHHKEYSKHPDPKLWHFLPLARFFIFEQDYSDMVPLCGFHHLQVTLREKQKG